MVSSSAAGLFGAALQDRAKDTGLTPRTFSIKAALIRPPEVVM